MFVIEEVIVDSEGRTLFNVVSDGLCITVDNYLDAQALRAILNTCVSYEALEVK
jgi:hypothetical protein